VTNVTVGATVRIKLQSSASKLHGQGPFQVEDHMESSVLLKRRGNPQTFTVRIEDLEEVK